MKMNAKKITEWKIRTLSEIMTTGKLKLAPKRNQAEVWSKKYEIFS